MREPSPFLLLEMFLWLVVARTCLYTGFIFTRVMGDWPLLCWKLVCHDDLEYFLRFERVPMTSTELPIGSLQFLTSYRCWLLPNGSFLQLYGFLLPHKKFNLFWKRFFLVDMILNISIVTCDCHSTPALSCSWGELSGYIKEPEF